MSIKLFKVIVICGFFISFFDSGLFSGDIYISQDAQGLDNGLDSLNAHSVQWLNQITNWGIGSDKVSAGDTVHLCGVISSTICIQGSGISENPITILFEQDAKMSAPYWDNWTPPLNQRGLPRSGAISARNKQHIIIDGGVNGIIESTETGTNFPEHSYSNGGVFFEYCDYIEVKNLNVINMYERTPNSTDYWTLGIGIKVLGSNVSIHDNYVENSYYGLMGGILAQNGENIKIYNNEITGMAVSLAATMGTDGYSLNNVEIHHNYIYDNTAWDGDIPYNPYDPARTIHRRDFIKIWGRTFTEDPYSNLKIYNNVIGPKLTGHVGASGWICMDSGYFLNPQIYNNIFISDATDGHSAFISVSANVVSTTTMNTKIYNNTFIGNSKNDPIHLGRTSLGHEIFNNIFYNAYLGFYAMDPVTDISYWDNNCWYPLSPPGSFQYKYHHASAWGTDPPYRWYEWVGELGFDAHSITEDPLFFDVSNPAGLDGIFFTEDDGLRLAENSQLKSAGRYEEEIGVYGTLRIIGAKGDINVDGAINILDVQACSNQVLGKENHGPASDINGDGEYNQLDVQAIRSLILGR